MSVDRTIEELSGTLTQLGVLVEHINTQIVGITSRLNLTLDNFDQSVAGIASDAGVITGQVGDTIAQIPHAWIFYLLFITLIIVLVLLSILIIINLIVRIHKIIKILRGDNSRSTTPLQSMIYSESKQPLNPSYPGSPQIRERLRDIAVPMETEPRRFGYSASSLKPHPKMNGSGHIDGNSSIMSDIPIVTHEMTIAEPYLSKRQSYINVDHNTEVESPKGYATRKHQYHGQHPSTNSHKSSPPAFINPRAEAV